MKTCDVLHLYLSKAICRIKLWVLSSPCSQVRHPCFTFILCNICCLLCVASCQHHQCSLLLLQDYPEERGDNVDYNLMQHYPHYNNSNHRHTPTIPYHHNSHHSIGMYRKLIKYHFIGVQLCSNLILTESDWARHCSLKSTTIVH